MSSTIRESWDTVFRMNVREFLNILCYSKDKADYEKRKIEEYKKKN